MQPTKIEQVKSVIQKILAGITILGVLVFVGFKIYPVVHGPEIFVSTLINGGSVTEPLVRISGIAAFTQDLIVNGKDLSLSPNGSFDEKFLLNPGYNVIHIDGTDRFGKITHKTYTLVLLDKTQPPTLTMNTPSPN
jgi:hypothetical protein